MGGTRGPSTEVSLGVSAEPGPKPKVTVPGAGSQQSCGGAQRQGSEGRGPAWGHLQQEGLWAGCGQWLSLIQPVFVRLSCVPALCWVGRWGGRGVSRMSK